jgi:hypothetical protein
MSHRQNYSEREDDTPSIPITSIEDLLKPQPPQWIVKPILEHGTRAAIYGQSNIGKSFAVIDLALSVATGLPWLPGASVIKRTAHGPVCYVTTEGQRGLGKRVLGWMAHQIERGIGVSPMDLEHTFFPVPVAVPLLQDGYVEGLVNAIRGACPDNCPLLVVFDTLAGTLAGADENENSEMTKLISKAGELQAMLASRYNAPEPAVLFVHHTGKQETTGLRGGYSLEAGLDVVLKLSRNKKTDDYSILACQKSKDEAVFDDLRITFKTITIGTDPEDGTDITTCAASFAADSYGTETKPEQPVEEPRPELSDPAIRVLEHLKQLPQASDGMTQKDLLVALEVKSRFAVQRPLNELVVAGLVAEGRRKNSKQKVYRLVRNGQVPHGEFSNNLSQPCSPATEITTPPPSLEGVGEVAHRVVAFTPKIGPTVRLGEPVPVRAIKFGSFTVDLDATAIEPSDDPLAWTTDLDELRTETANELNDYEEAMRR